MNITKAARPALHIAKAMYRWSMAGSMFCQGQRTFRGLEPKVNSQTRSRQV